MWRRSGRRPKVNQIIPLEVQGSRRRTCRVSCCMVIDGWGKESQQRDQVGGVGDVSRALKSDRIRRCWAGKTSMEIAFVLPDLVIWGTALSTDQLIFAYCCSSLVSGLICASSRFCIIYSIFFSDHLS